jgi:hypothetical protein
MRQEKCISQNNTLFLLTYNEHVMDPRIVANAFNTFFLSLAENLNLHQGGREYAHSLLKDAFPGVFPSTNIIPTTETEIGSVIHSLNSKKKNHKVMMK